MVFVGLEDGERRKHVGQGRSARRRSRSWQRLGPQLWGPRQHERVQPGMTSAIHATCSRETSTCRVGVSAGPFGSATAESDLHNIRDDSQNSRRSLKRLEREGLIRTSPLSSDDRALTLTDRGRDLLEANRYERHDRTHEPRQTFYAISDADQHGQAPSRPDVSRPLPAALGGHRRARQPLPEAHRTGTHDRAGHAPRCCAR